MDAAEITDDQVVALSRIEAEALTTGAPRGTGELVTVIWKGERVGSFPRDELETVGATFITTE